MKFKLSSKGEGGPDYIAEFTAFVALLVFGAICFSPILLILILEKYA